MTNRIKKMWVRPNLSKVVKVVLVSDPSVAGQQTVGLVGDVAHILPLTNEKLSLEELRGNMRTRALFGFTHVATQT